MAQRPKEPKAYSAHSLIIAYFFGAWPSLLDTHHHVRSVYDNKMFRACGCLWVPCSNWVCEGSKTLGMGTAKGYSEEGSALGLIHVYINLLTAGWKNNLANGENGK